MSEREWTDGRRESEPVSPTDIAVVGMAGRFPASRDLRELWRNLTSGTDCITRFGDEELIAAGVDPEQLRDPDYVKARGVLADIDLFDAEFFGVTPRDARLMDPQHRIFLECFYHALEDAACDPATFEGAIGLFAGAGAPTYLLSNLVPNRELLESVSLHDLLLTNEADHLTTRVAYKLDLRGPAVTVLTTCSTSLVATCLACQSLLAYHSDLALAGGVTVTVPQTTGYRAQRGLLSPDGRVRPFDAEAQGVVSGAGVGVVALKRLADALEDGDPIRAVIKGFALNNDGSDKIGYTAPSVTGHAEVVATAQAMAGVAPETIDFVEAHGTATELGDPIEVDALRRAFQGRERSTCALGSIKGNIGHADAAAGVASLIKMVLALEHRQIPPCPHFQEPNPRLELEDGPFYVNRDPLSWQRRNGPRRGAVSSLGLGGTNAHLILEEAPGREPSGPSRSWQLLTVSARSAGGLETAASDLAAHLSDHPETDLADVAFTRHLGRRHFEHRRAVVCRSADEAVELLAQDDPRWVLDGRAEYRGRPVAFLLSGVGGPLSGTTAELYRSEPVFREAVDRCAEILVPEIGSDLRHAFHPGELAEADSQPESIGTASAGCFVVDYALALLWRSWGVEPEAMLGHSTGEYVAACLAGVLSLDDALAAVALRGRLADLVPSGRMLSVAMGAERLEELLPPEVSVAAYNAPELSVVSGPEEAMAKLAAELEERDVEIRDMGISRAGHSAMLEPVVGELEAFLASRELGEPEIPFVSNVTGDWITAEEATDPAYWCRHFRRPVRFSAGVRRLLETPARVLLEVGAGRTLASLAAKHTPETGPRIIVSSLGDPGLGEAPDTARLLAALGRLWLAGVEPDWRAFYAGQRRQRVAVPTYPFERRRYWIDPPPGARLSPYGSGLASAPSAPAGPLQVRSWRRTAVPRPFAPSAAGRSARWLVLAPAAAEAEAVARGLKGPTRGVEAAAWGSGGIPQGEGGDGAPPSPAAFGRILTELASGEGVPEEVVLLDGDGEGGPPAPGYRFWPLSALLSLLEALGRQPLEPSARLWVVTRGSVLVDGGEEPDPGAAALAGASAALVAGPAPLQVRHLDLPPGGDGARVAERLLAEAGVGDRLVAYRRSFRWIPALEPVAAPREDGAGVAPCGDGWCLVSGSLAGPAGDLAPAFAELGARRLAILEPGEVPPRDEWDRWLADGAPEELGDAAAPPPAATGFEGEDLVREVRRLEDEVAEAVAVEDYPLELERGLDGLCTAYIHRYLVDAGVDPRVGRSYDRTRLREDLGILDEFSKFYDFFLKTLGEDGIVEIDGDRLEFVHPPEEVPDPERLRADLARRYPAYSTELDVIAHCVEQYPRALTGAIDNTSVLFPDGRTDISAPVVENWKRHSNAAIYLRAVAELLPLLSSDGPLRILEVGGGNGILTWEAAPRLTGRVEEYRFTDIGRTFVLNAQRRAEEEGLDFMSFGTLDISREPSRQGFDRHAWDVLLAFNVVHATSDIRATLGHLRSLVRPGGLLLLLESARQRRSSTMVGGLAEGWWYFQDHDIRPHSPLLSHEGWQEVVAGEGFRTEGVFPAAGPARETADHAFVLLQEGSPIATEAYREWRRGRIREGAGRARRGIRTLRRLEERGIRLAVGRTMEGVLREVGGPAAVSAVAHAADAVGGREGAGGARLELRRLEHEAERFEALTEALSGAAPELRLTVVPASRAEGVVPRALAGYLEARGAADRGWRNVEWEPGGDAAAGAVALRRLLAVEGRGGFVVSPAREAGPWADGTEPAPTEEGEGGFVAPGTEVEKATARIWAEVFGVSRIGLHDNFFDLGGESLLATQLVSRLRATLGADVSIRSFYQNPTVAAIAELVAAQGPANDDRDEEDRITPASREAYRATRSARGELQLERPAGVGPHEESG